jgi:endonuclease/exonuclease/phosphatase family metal-dependent hydrolase
VADKACHELARQARPLEAWIDAQARAGHRFAVLGDFNRDLQSEEARGNALGPDGSFWSEIHEAGVPKVTLRNAAKGAAFLNCVPGQGYHGYIDNILLSPSLVPEVVPGSFARITYTAADARHARLSDHCPVSIRLKTRAAAAN